MKKIKIILLSVLSIISFPACNDFLELYPDNAQTSEQYWNTKGEVEAVVAAGYVMLRGSVEQLFVWGEIRANGIAIYNGSVDRSKTSLEVKQLTMTSSNDYVKWANMYKVINMSNSVLKYAPAVLTIDPSFTEGEMNGYFSEVYFLRSLAYFYLVRTFGEVPYITQPYVDDQTSFDYAKSTEEEILENIKADLITALVTAKDYYPETSLTDQPNTKGRATKWSIYALLADIYLWEGDYDKCIEMCENVINSQRVGLISKDLWFTNFYPGNSNESIFEIQYNYLKGQTNSFASWFSAASNYSSFNWGVQDYPLVNYLYASSTELGDIRGVGGTYLYSGMATFLWKYVGTNLYDIDVTQRTTDENDQNFIIYRLAEIYFMRAEAYIMKGGDYYQTAMGDLALIRSRAGIEENLIPYGSEEEMLLFLYHEKMREFCGEGKTWFDLFRIGKRDNYRYREFLIQQVLTTVEPGQYGIVRSKLLNNGALYMPIHTDEMQSNKLLEQNSYYKSLGY